MRATEILMDEHRLIERAITAMQIAADRLSKGDEIRPQFFLNASLFITNFADGCHHKKEEGVLFIAMNEAGIPSTGGPLAAMLADHELGREFNRELKKATVSWEKGVKNAREAVIHNALGYASLLRVHIMKEDKIVFPLAERVIPAEKHEQVMVDFERVERDEIAPGIHEKYLALVEVMEKEC